MPSAPRILQYSDKFLIGILEIFRLEKSDGFGIPSKFLKISDAVCSSDKIRSEKKIDKYQRN